MQPRATEPQARENMIRLVQAWCQATGNTLMTAGRYAHSDPRFFVDLIARHKKWIKQGKPNRVESDRKGSFTVRCHDKVVAWFFDLSNWPEGTTSDSFPELNEISYKPQGEANGTDQKHGIKTTQAAQGQGRGRAAGQLARLRNLDF